MAYTKKTWVDRNVQYPGRRKLSAVSGQTNVYDIVRSEGTITAAGDAFNAENMNDLEDRVKGGLDNCYSKDELIFTYDSSTKTLDITLK